MLIQNRLDFYCVEVTRVTVVILPGAEASITRSDPNLTAADSAAGHR